MRLAGIVLIVCVLTVGQSVAQDPFPGSTLISPLDTNASYLIDMDQNITMVWHGSNTPGMVAYLLPDQSLLRPSRDPSGAFQSGGTGGRIQRIDANEMVVWDYLFSTEEYQQHHDIEPMPNGNVLVIAWERKTRQQALDAGRQTLSGDMWPTMIAELRPVGATDAEIVWEWHLWDHLIQDVDPTKPNYGVVANHPELIDINLSGAANGSWDHANAIDYNTELDQIVFSCRKLHEFYIIDHSTTTEEAAGHAGGRSGKGGDILYRWGNPQNYDRGGPEDRYYYAVHSAQWIEPGLPGAGNILTFNNGFRGAPDNYSSVEEIVTPILPDGNYRLEEGQAFEPVTPTWSYSNPSTFYSQAQGGVQRLPNGNTLITDSDDGIIFEVTSGGTVVWSHFAPASVHRALRYWSRPVSAAEEPRAPIVLRRISPNPFNAATVINYYLTRRSNVVLEVFDLAGRHVDTLLHGERPAGIYETTWQGLDRWGHPVSSGVYICRIATPTAALTHKMVLTK